MRRPSISDEAELLAREEFERHRRQAESRGGGMERERRDALRDLHFMRCPTCGDQLHEIKCRGVLVDKCYSCKGIWLASAELEKLTEGEDVVSRVLGYFSRN